jgi:uncharacterized protein (DUF4415 family)
MNTNKTLSKTGKQKGKQIAAIKGGETGRSVVIESKNPSSFRADRKMYKPLKVTVTFRLDADILAWLKKDGKGYQTRMNTILRSVMENEGKAGQAAANRVNHGK